MNNYLFSKKNRVLLNELVRTAFKLRYQGSVVGYLWSILKPMFLFAIMYVVFVRFLKFGAGVPHFAIGMLLGTVLWTFFQETTTQGMFAIVDRGDLLRKIAFPKQIIMLSTTLNALINLGINLVIVLIFAIFNGVNFSWTLILMIPLVFELFLFSYGVALILTTVFVKFRDIGPVWEIFSQALFYGTPIIYPISLVIQMSPKIANFLMINPLAQIISDARNVMTWAGTPTIWSMTNIWFGMIPIIISVVIYLIGNWMFNKNAPRFAEVL